VYRLVVGLLAIAWLASARPAGADVIHDIIVQDNTKTTSDTVEYIAQIERGQQWTPDMAFEINRRLVTSGLFKDVNVFWEPAKDGNGVDVHLVVKDKFSWVIAPAFYDQPTNVGGGVGYGENNLLGTNQKVLVYGQIATGDSFFIGVWQVPAIKNSRFDMQLDTYLADSRNFEYAEPTKYISNPPEIRESRLIYLNGGFKFGFRLFRGVKLDTRIRTAYVSYEPPSLVDGATPQQVNGASSTSTAIPKPGIEGWDTSNEWDLTIDRRANWYGIATGYKIVLSFERTIDSLSDFHYYEGGLSLFRAYKVLERHNLALKGQIQAGHHMPFQQEYTMGGTNMRGYANNEFRGDFYAGATAEYSVPLFTIWELSVRGLGFWDTGYINNFTCGACQPGDTTNPQRNYLPDSRLYGLDGFKNSVGVGTRFYLRSIVLPLLGLDVGYGLEARDFQVYLAIGLTD
jgi:outer membrane protein insertion porin family